jgi:hypothetical protein
MADNTQPVWLIDNLKFRAFEGVQFETVKVIHTY